jgi:hypothetical protein
LSVPFVFLGTADDRSQAYPYAPTDRHRADLETLIVMNAALSPPIAIEEGFLLASDEILCLGECGAVLIAAVEAGLVKIMSRRGDLVGYAEDRRALNHATPPATPEALRFMEALQAICAKADAFLPYPTASIDKVTAERFRALLDLPNVKALLERANVARAPFADRFDKLYATGLDGKPWSARAAWEAAAIAQFGPRASATRALMVLANRQRQLIRAAALAELLDQPVIVETGFELGGEDLIEPGSPVLADIAIRTLARRELIANASIEVLTREYRALFDALADKASPLGRAKAAWLAASSGARGEARGSMFASRFFDATRDYAARLAEFSSAHAPAAPMMASGAMDILETGMSLALPASHQILLGNTLSRRDLLAGASMFGMAAAEYLLRPWSLRRDAASRSRLIVNRLEPSTLDGVGALSLERTNFHERVVVSPDRARASLQR